MQVASVASRQAQSVEILEYSAWVKVHLAEHVVRNSLAAELLADRQAEKTLDQRNSLALDQRNSLAAELLACG